MNSIDDEAKSWNDVSASGASVPAVRAKRGPAAGVTRSDVREAYRRWAPVYDFTFGALMQRHRRLVHTAVVENGARRVLELGVGTGLSLHHYPAGTAVVGVDLSPEMLERAQARIAQGLPANIELRLGDAEGLDFPDGDFDLVVLLFVVSVTPNAQALLDEVARVLRPQGRVLVVNHFSGVRGFRWLERLFAPLAAQVGFAQLPLAQVAEHPRLCPVRIEGLRPFGFFSRVDLIRRNDA